MSSGTEAADSQTEVKTEVKTEVQPEARSRSEENDLNAEVQTKGAGLSKDVVVLAVDGSKQAEEAFNWYHEHLHRPGSTVLLVHSLEVSGMPTRDSWDSQLSSGNKKRDDLRDKYTKLFKDSGISGKFISDFEKPGEFVVETARKENATYIVMGTRGLGKIRRTVMGSVSDFVVHHANCPVVVCRQK